MCICFTRYNTATKSKVWGRCFVISLLSVMFYTFLFRKKRQSDSKKEETKEKTKEMLGSQEGDDEFSDIMSQYLLQADQGY